MNYKIVSTEVDPSDYCQTATTNTSRKKGGPPTIAYCKKPAKYILLAFTEVPICEDCYQQFLHDGKIDKK